MNNISHDDVNSSFKNPLVFLDIVIGDEKAGRVICELFKDITPKTAENFRALCTGEQGIGVKGKPLCFKDTIFHRAVPEALVQGGDITNQNGTGGESIYGPFFDDENFDIKHTKEGLLSMANTGKPNTNNSQFFVTVAPCQHLDGKNVVFGQILSGYQIFRWISRLETQDDRPTVKCKISNCGEVDPLGNWGVEEDDETDDVYPPWPHDCHQLSKLEEEELKTIFMRIKDSGTFYFKANNLVDAYRKYKKAYQYLLWMENKLTESNDLKVVSLLNLAAVEIKMKKYKDCLSHCDQVLKLDEKNAKALFRRGQAHVGLNNYHLGLKDLKSAQRLFPNDKGINLEISNVNELISNYLAREKRVYSKMFQ
nr:PREDICTED: peptidyl-prolyl cis-trans isomerase D [Bemisia tabaci]